MKRNILAATLVAFFSCPSFGILEAGTPVGQGSERCEKTCGQAIQTVYLTVSVTKAPDEEQNADIKILRAISRLEENTTAGKAESNGKCTFRSTIERLWPKHQLPSYAAATVFLKIETNCLQSYVSWYQRRFHGQFWNQARNPVYIHEPPPTPAGAVTGSN